MYGGTFDPPHSGHLAVAQAVAQHCEVAKVLFVVAGEPWQKLAAGVAVTPAADRLAMVQALVAASQQPKFEVSAVELERGGPAYTAETLDELARQHPGTELLLVVGSDLVSQLETWHEPERVRQLASLLVVERPGFENPPLPAGWSGSYLRGELVDISSSQLREQLGGPAAQSGGMPAGLLENSPPGLLENSPAGLPALQPETYIPDVVAEIIAVRGLYRDRPEVLDGAERG